MPRIKEFLTILALAAVSCNASSPVEPVPVTPAWALGHIVWEDQFNTRDAVLRLVNGYLDRGIPVSGVIIDSPWTTCYNNFTWDRTLYPEPEALLAELKSRGVHSLLWLTGCTNVTCNDRGQQKSDNFDEAVAKGYGVNDGQTSRWWKGDGIHIDFTNPDAVQWWYGLLDSVMAEGVDGFKVDGGETAFGDSVKTSLGVLSNRDFRRYYYDAMYDYTVSRRPETGIILARPYSTKSGHGINAEFANKSKMSLGWCGDFSGDWTGLKEQIADVYNSALAGYGAVGTEIGGFYRAPSTKEQLVRYAQFGAMTACMINGGSNRPFENHIPWWHGEDAGRAYKEAVLLHCRLVPYIFSTLVDAHLHGGTLIRNADLEAESHCLGPDFFTKAITGDGGHVRFTLPSGCDWADMRTRERFPGGSVIERDYTLDEFPLFVRVGAIVPMNTGDGLTVFVCPGDKVAETTIHWPEGDGIAYRDIHVRFDPATGKADVTSDGELVPHGMVVN
ncbi:MAG: hypothetical protein J5737_00335 [Bacteroidales bacterium]|nr:hypothetical protein [Bacteroidales bacterium]